MNNATATSIREEIATATANNGFIAVAGYKSKSGQVANITLQPLGSGGYHRLIHESIALVESGNVVKPNNISEEVWGVAVNEQLASWRKTLDGGHGRRNGYKQKSKGFYGHDRDESEDTAVYIRNVVVVSKTILEKGEFKEVKSRDKTLAKKALVRQTPLAKYQACLKLREGYFSRLAWAKNIVE